MMSSNGDKLRQQLVPIVAELDCSVTVGMAKLRKALDEAKRLHQRRGVDDDGYTSAARHGWITGVEDALKMLRPAQEAHDRFTAWLREVELQEVDHCGLTAEERATLASRAGRVDA
jgi:hypothetical protein